MRAMHGVRAIRLLGLVAAFAAFTGTANADTSVERPGSILIFPKVVSSATRDTVIQVTNTGNMLNEVSCFYVDGESCVITDFSLILTRQQPIHWRVGSGRPVNPLDDFGTDGSGLDPGVIPPVGEGFEGGLVCVETDNGEPVAQNKLKGEASLQDLSGSPNANDSKYNAIALSGDSTPGGNDLDTNLELNGAEYSRCSTSHRLDVITEAVDGDPILGAASQVLTNVTVLPCDLDFRRATAAEVVISQFAWNEFEGFASGPDRTFSCWDSFTVDTSGLNPQTTFATVQFDTDRPVTMVAEQFTTDSSAAPISASAARNVHFLAGSTEEDSTIRLAPIQ